MTTSMASINYVPKGISCETAYYGPGDVQDVESVDELETLLSRADRAWLHFEAVAITGQGLLATLDAVAIMVIERLRQGCS